MCFWSRSEVAQHLKDSDPTMAMDLFRRALADVVPYCSSLCLAGGGEFLADPLVEERLSILGDTLRSHPEVMFFQTSNASLLTAERLHFLNGVRRVGFGLSIDSADALTYACIRRGGTLAEVMSNIRSLRSNLHAVGVEEVHIQLNVVMMRRNIFSIPDVLRLAREIHASVFLEHPQGFGPDDLRQESLFRFPAFSNAFMNQCQRLAEMLNVALLRPPPFAISSDEVKKYYDAIKERKLFCYQLDNSGPIQIQANGDVVICCQNLLFGNLHGQSFKDIFFSSHFHEYRAAIAQGHPLPPCDHCRHLYRAAPYLYESSVYDLDIPPASRNFNPEPDFEREGFFDWLDEFSEAKLRRELRKDYFAHAKRLVTRGLTDEIASFGRKKTMDEKVASWIREDVKLVVYPAGRVAAWLLENTLLSKVNILALSDRNPEMHGKSFRGYSVVSPDDIPSLNPGALLVASDLYRDQICRDFAHLEEIGIKVVTI
jgi:MoaA/NifB/PqqE/SkfB family radical SAM enzyme